MIPALLVRTLASGGNSSDSSNALAADQREVACPPRRAACTAVCHARQPSLGALAARDENGREQSGKPLNHSRNHIFWSGTETVTGKPDGKTKSILLDIGNGIFRSETYRLRSGIGKSKREHYIYGRFKYFPNDNDVS